MARRKTGAEARVERITWYICVLILIGMNYFDRQLLLPSWIVPGLIGIVLIVSSVYQQFVYELSIIALSVGVVMILAVAFEIYYTWPFDLRLLSIVGVVVVILAGVITNEG